MHVLLRERFQRRPAIPQLVLNQGCPARIDEKIKGDEDRRMRRRELADPTLGRVDTLE